MTSWNFATDEQKINTLPEDDKQLYQSLKDKLVFAFDEFANTNVKTTIKATEEINEICWAQINNSKNPNKKEEKDQNDGSKLNNTTKTTPLFLREFYSHSSFLLSFCFLGVFFESFY